MNIVIKNRSSVFTAEVYTDQDSTTIEFLCKHPRAEVEQPCCSSPDSDGLWSCGCQGEISVWCPDCKNKDMSEDDMDRIVGIKW